MALQIGFCSTFFFFFFLMTFYWRFQWSQNAAYFPHSSNMHSSQLQVKIELTEYKSTYKYYEYFYLPVFFCAVYQWQASFKTGNQCDKNKG